MDTGISRLIPELNTPILIEYCCPASGITYHKACPNKHCPANIVKYNSNPSGCFIQQPRIALADLSYAMRLTTHEIRKRYSRGLDIGNKFIIFYQWLQLQRENQTIARGCSKCGLPTPNNLDCIILRRCQRRQKFINYMRQCYPMRLAPLKMQATEFWATVLAQNQGKFTILSKQHLLRANKLIARLSYLNPGAVHADH
jgi:hypothetical protein